MLSVVGKVCFEVVSVSRLKGEYIPTIYLNIRNAVDNGRFLGQMRFNLDSIYSEDDIRMAFDVIDTSKIDPSTQEGAEWLEDIVIGGLIWATMDNHNLIPKKAKAYMVVHDYDENNLRLNMINAKIRALLKEFGCEEVVRDKFIFDPLSKGGNKRLSDFLKTRNRK